MVIIHNIYHCGIRYLKKFLNNGNSIQIFLFEKTEIKIEFYPRNLSLRFYTNFKKIMIEVVYKYLK